MNEPTAFWLTDPDRTAIERYAGVLRDHVAAFDGIWGDIAPVSFACEAWRLATPPVSDPGFIRWHRRVLAVRFERNAYDGSLNGHLEIASPLPAGLRASRAWWRDNGWREWPEIFGQFVTPAEADLAKVPFVRPVLLIDVPLPLDDLPPTPDGPEQRFAETAHRALLVMVRDLNRLVAPLVTKLDES